MCFHNELTWCETFTTVIFTNFVCFMIEIFLNVGKYFSSSVRRNKNLLLYRKMHLTCLLLSVCFVYWQRILIVRSVDQQTIYFSPLKLVVFRYSEFILSKYSVEINLSFQMFLHYTQLNTNNKSAVQRAPTNTSKFVK